MGTSHQLIKYAGYLRFADLAGVVVNSMARTVQHDHVGNVALVVLLNELLLLGRPFRTQIDDHKMHSSLILLVETDGAASLPLGIESALAEHEHVIGLAPDGTVFEVVAGDEGAVLAVARIVKPRIQPQVFGGPQARRRRLARHCHRWNSSGMRWSS